MDFQIKLNEQGIEVASVAQLKDCFDPTWPGVQDWVKQTTPHLLRAINATRSIIDPDAIGMGGLIPKKTSGVNANVFESIGCKKQYRFIDMARRYRQQVR